MTKRKIKKIAYQQIYRQGRGHQEVYEELKTDKLTFNKIIATQLREIPSKGIYNKWKPFIISYVILIGIFAILRLIGLGTLIGDKVGNTVLILLLSAYLILPVVGIFGALTARTELMKGASVALAIFTFRGLSKMDFDGPTIIALTAVAIIIFLGLFVPYKMRTPFTSTLIKTEIDGKTVTDLTIKFSDVNFNENEDLLDNELV